VKLNVDDKSSELSKTGEQQTSELLRRLDEICIHAVKLGSDSSEGDSLNDIKESFSKQIREILERLEYEANLNNGLKQSLHRFHIIQNLCETIARSKSIQEIFGTFLKIIPKILSFTTAAVYLLNRKTGVFELKAEEELSQSHREIIQSHFDEGIISWTFSERRTVIIPYLPDVTLDTHSPAKGFVIIPLLSGDNQIGFVSVWNESIQGIQKEAQLGILDLLARQAAIAIENCELYDELRDANTLLKKSQQQVLTSEKMAAIGVLASGIAHEINNPLQVIFSKVQLLKKHSEDEKVRLSLEAVEKEALRISNIISSVLRNARSQTHPELNPTKVHDIVQDVLTVAHSKLSLQNIHAKCEFAPEVPEILANAGELSQVLTNLIENARQAMKNGGELSIQTRVKGRYFLLVVGDSGCGISEDNLTRIFEPFFTTKEPNEGTGLGLFLCYQIIERHHGKITVESTVGKGTKFTIQLPLPTKTDT
jgi:signal transduction histidine kinase